MTPEKINIFYSKDGCITLIIAWHPHNLNDALLCVSNFIAGMKCEEPEQATRPKPVIMVNAGPKPNVEKKPRKSRRRFTDEQEEEIIARYKAGDGPKAIAESLGCARSTIIHIISRRGATEGRTGQHLKKKPEPLPEPEPEPI